MIDALRTPIGRYGGVLANARPDDLAAHVIAAAVERNGLPVAEIDEVYMGCTNQAGRGQPQRRAHGRCCWPGLPVEVPGVTVNRLCASGLEAVNQARARRSSCGEADLVLAGGVESMTRAPLVMPKPDRSFPRGGADGVRHDASAGGSSNPRMEELHGTDSMGETAENVARALRRLARGPGRVRAREPPPRAWPPQEAGRFDDEIVPVRVPQPKGEPVTVHSDEGPRADTTLEKLATLRPIFREGGTVTAGNSSQINDGAACLVLASAERAQALGREPLARIVSTRRGRRASPA